MNGWLITWFPAGHPREDLVVTILPDDYTTEEVTIVLRTLFLVATHTFRELLVDLHGGGVRPVVRQSRHANEYIRLVIDLGSDAMEARVAKDITVTEDDQQQETIRWQEQKHNGE